jgi:capsular polysaccharide biosynthesis protein
MAVVATEPRTLGAGLARAARRHLRLIAAFVVAVTAVAALYSFLAGDRYEARAELLVQPVGDDPLYAGLRLPRDAETVANLVVAPQVLDAIRIRLDFDSREAVRDAVDARAVGESNVVAITGTASAGVRAAQVANAFADETIGQQSARFQAAVAGLIDRNRTALELIPAGERNTAEAEALAARARELRSLLGLPDPTLQKVGDAVAPQEPVWPKPEWIIPLAFVASLLASLGVALVLEWEPPRRAPAPAPVPARVPPEPGPEPEPEPEPEPVVSTSGEPAPPPEAAPGAWNLEELERLVAERAGEFTPDQVVEWEAYLFTLRDQASSDGRLPPAFDWLVEDVFGTLLRK